MPYIAVSQNSIPDVQSRVEALAPETVLNLQVTVNNAPMPKTFVREGLTWPWYEYNGNGGVEQCVVYDINYTTSAVCWFIDDQGIYRVKIEMPDPFTVDVLTNDDTDFAYLMDFGAVTFIDDTPVDPPPPDPEPEEPPMTTPIYGAGLVSAVVVAAALRAQLDEQVGWHKSISNVPVTGVTGISKPLTWDLEDPDTDAGYLNASQVTTLIQNQGFRYWGNRNCSSDPRFSFEVATRTAQTVLETLIEGCFPFVDQPLTPSLAKDIIDSIQAKLTEFVSTGRLIGASVWYDEAQNSTEGLSQGQMWIDYDYTPVPTLENLGLNQRITDRYLVDFAKLVAQAA